MIELKLISNSKLIIATSRYYIYVIPMSITIDIYKSHRKGNRIKVHHYKKKINQMQMKAIMEEMRDKKVLGIHKTHLTTILQGCCPVAQSCLTL